MNEDILIASAVAQVSNRFAVHTEKDMSRFIFLSGSGDTATLISSIAISAENMADFAGLILSDAAKRQEMLIPPPSEQTLASGTSNDNLDTSGNKDD